MRISAGRPSNARSISSPPAAMRCAPRALTPRSQDQGRALARVAPRLRPAIPAECRQRSSRRHDECPHGAQGQGRGGARRPGCSAQVEEYFSNSFRPATHSCFPARCCALRDSRKRMPVSDAFSQDPKNPRLCRGQVSAVDLSAESVRASCDPDKRKTLPIRCATGCRSRRRNPCCPGATNC